MAEQMDPWEILARLQAAELFPNATARMIIDNFGAEMARVPIQADHRAGVSDPLQLLEMLRNQLARIDGAASLLDDLDLAMLPHAMRDQRRAAALAWHTSGASSLPPQLNDLPLGILRGWPRQETVSADLLGLVADWKWVVTQDHVMPKARGMVSQELSRHADRLKQQLDDQALIAACLSALRPELDDVHHANCAALIEDLVVTTEHKTGHAILNKAISCDPSQLRDLTTRPLSEGETHDLILILTMRFGDVANDWASWQTWLNEQADSNHALHMIPTDRKALTLWLAAWHQGKDLREFPELTALVLAGMQETTAETFGSTWDSILPTSERALLRSATQSAETATTETAEDPVTASDITHADDTTLPAYNPNQQMEIEQKAKPDWLRLLKRFVDQHIVLILGAVMILAGTTLLAYYTWDKHWLVRYTMLPGLLAALTIALARVGNWLERSDAELMNTATILRGLAVGLLPAHALVPALLAADDVVTAKYIAVPAALLVYGIGIGFALRRWCRAVHPSFSGSISSLASALGAGVATVALGPVATWLGVGPETIPTLLWCAMAGAMALAISAVNRFTRALNQPNEADASENDQHAALRAERLAWFIGGTLVAALGQGLAWSHGLLDIVPQTAAYGPLIVAAGWLVLLVERRANRRFAVRTGNLRSESFIGFATMALGVALSMAHPWWRLVALAAASAGWIDQARGRRARHQARLHWQLAAIWLVATGLSVATLPGLPLVLRPVIMAAVGLAAVIAASRLTPRAIARPLRAVGIVGLGLAVVSTVISQWHWGSDPLIAGFTLLGIASVVAWQACLVDRQRWALIAVSISIVALPYLGCVDMQGRNWHGNHLVFGLTCLAILWSLIGRIPGATTLAQSRSLVGFVLGLMAILALCIRIFAEDGRPALEAEGAMWRMALDYGGTLGMAAVLIAVSWWSRSLIPGLLAVVVLIILFPELKEQFASTFDQLGWGNGLGGGIMALTLAMLVWPLRRTRWTLSDGDALFGSVYFPWRRRNHTLISWPLLAAAIFLSIRLDTATLAKQWLHHSGEIPLPTVIAVLITVPTWLLIACWRGPNPGHSGTERLVLQRWWRRGTALVYAATIILATVVCWRGSLPATWSNGSALATGFVALAVSTRLLALWPWSSAWTHAGLAARVDQFISALAPMTASLCVVFLVANQPTAHYALLAVVATLLTLSSSWRMARPSKDLDAWGIISEPLSATRGMWLGCWGWGLAWALGIIAASFNDFSSLLSHDLPPSWAERLDWHVLDILSWAALAIQLPLIAHHVRAGATTNPLGNLGKSLALSLPVVLAGLVVTAVAAWLQGERSLTTTFALTLALVSWAWLQHNWLAMTAAICLGWLGLQLDSGSYQEILTNTSAPQHLGLLAALLALSPAVVDRLQAWPRLSSRLTALYPKGNATFPFVAAMLVSSLALALAWLIPAHRAGANDVWAWLSLLVGPVLALAYRGQPALADWRDHVARLVTFLVLSSNCITAVHLLAGPWLHAGGVHAVHQVAVGLALCVMICAASTRAFPFLLQPVRGANLVSAGVVLLLVAGNYLAHPDLSSVTSWRLIISALVAIVAGRAFRHFAQGHSKRPDGWQLVGTAGYHFALSLGLTCAALVIPALQTPTLALIALAVPVVYFAIRSEKDPAYRNSTMILGSLLVLLTLFRSAFILLLFPESGAEVGRHDHFHSNAPMLAILGFILMRQVALGGDRLFGLLGGTATMVGFYFILTSMPGLSPFVDPIAGAWCAIGLGHAITLITQQRSPVRTGLLRLLNCDEDTWIKLRRSWGIIMQMAVQAAVLVGAISALFDSDDYAAASLGLGAASLLVHHSLIREGRWHLWMASWQMLGGICIMASGSWYLGTFTPSASLLGAWAILLTVSLATTASWLSRHFLPNSTWLHGALVHPALWAPQVLMGLLMLPVGSAQAVVIAVVWCIWLAALPLSHKHDWAAWALPFALAALVVPITAWQNWPLLSGKPSMLLTNLALIVTMLPNILRQYGMANRVRSDAEVAPLFWRLIDSLIRAPMALSTSVLSFATILCSIQIIVQVVGDHPVGWWPMGTAMLLAYLWYQEAKLRQRAWCLLIAQIAIGLTLTAGRHYLRQVIPEYDPAYDVWMALGLTVLIHGAKQWWHPSERWMRLPIAWSAAAVPLATLGWIWWQGLGTDLALISLALHCVGFSYLGGRDRHSPFLAMAIFSLIGLAVVAAWGNLGLRVIHAYTIPVGLGILALLHLFREQLPQQVRHGLRAVILLIMLGSTAFHALLDGDHPLVFHFTLLGLGLAALMAGIFLHVRMYVIAGVLGALLALGSLTVLGLSEVERGVRMSLIGGMILLLGAGLVAGTIAMKSRREAILTWLERWRDRLRHWE